MFKSKDKIGFRIITLGFLVIGALVALFLLAPNRASVMPVESQPLALDTHYDDFDPAMKKWRNHLTSKAVANIVNTSVLSINAQAHLAPFMVPLAPLGPICQIYSSYITHAR